MRTRLLAYLLFVAFAGCGSSENHGDDGGVQGDGTIGDGPPPGVPLGDRIVVSTISTSAPVMGGRSNWRIWGTGSLGVSPVFTVPMADCGTLVGYTTGSGTPSAHVARLDPNDHAMATYDLGAFELRGLAAEPDGHWAALLWDSVPNPAVLHVARFTAGGSPGWSTMLTDTLAAPTDFGIGESRLEYGNGQYGAYFHVHGISGFAMGHEGDQLQWLNASSGAASVQWEWGCSHSMSELLRFDGAMFMPACITDCFPGTSGNFSTTSIGGLYLNHDQRKVLDVDGGCNGSVAGELGGAAPSNPGFKIVFNAHQVAAVPGQSSYSPQTMNQDIGFASIAADLTPSSVVWLTTTSGNEANASTARWRPNGDDAEQYVVGWAATGTSSSYKLARLSATGSFLDQPIDITNKARWGERDDPFRTHQNGDIVWSWFDAAGDSSFHLARIRSGRTCP